MTESREETSIYVIAPVLIDGTTMAPCKVGISATLPNRLKSIQVGSSQKLALAYYFRIPTRPLAHKIERQFHRDNAGYRLQGEWFNIAPREAAADISERITIMIESASDILHHERIAALLDAGKWR